MEDKLALSNFGSFSGFGGRERERERETERVSCFKPLFSQSRPESPTEGKREEEGGGGLFRPLFFVVYLYKVI